MKDSSKNNGSSTSFWIIVLLIVLCFCFIANICMGAIYIPFKQVLLLLMGQGIERESWEYIILNYRFPKAIIAVLVGIALSVSGLMMQTLFRNPMADSYVLGLSSGASLGVAIVILGASFLPVYLQGFFISSGGIVAASILGSFCILLLILLVARKVQDSVTLLIIGLMFGSFASAVVGVLTYFSTAEQLKRYTFWAMGSLGNLDWNIVFFFTVAVLVGLAFTFMSFKALDSLLLGERYAASLGIHVKRARILIILATSILSGVSTAFVGPIAFVGLAVPHIARILFKTSSHKVLCLASMLLGAILMLICDMITQYPGQAFVLPINAITSILGAPVVIWLILKKN
ncbi:iron ABC transporter permease [Flavobacterium sp. NKUCC04_CG]|uniref:iron ABC transporter permease n=1 Tax=Flavobacterium sp. NKUCC04_CG TaxID=2842121 RepID=UPI001C5BBE49|nr:iron ABC transporter permease [Flavobacterium sp. NKUCC04_CG]MBW3519610.1 iron ABC transporter permease [Flavobacterium sp. NKUCC04_CG]